MTELRPTENAELNERLPARAEPGSIQAHRGQPMRPVDGANLTHNPTDLDFSRTVVDRDEIWQRFGSGIHNRVAARLGTLVEWWADEQDGERSATVLGTRALITISPTINDTGGRAYQLRSIPLDEGSFRQKRVTGKSTSRPATVRARPGLTTPPLAPNPMADRLTSWMSGFLGNLPGQAQELLQEPFKHSTQSLWNNYYCIRHNSTSGFGDTKFTAWCYLASASTLTFAHGFGYGPQDMSGPISWDLTCIRAAVSKPGTDLVRG